MVNILAKEGMKQYVHKNPDPTFAMAEALDAYNRKKKLQQKKGQDITPAMVIHLIQQIVKAAGFRFIGYFRIQNIKTGDIFKSVYRRDDERK